MTSKSSTQIEPIDLPFVPPFVFNQVEEKAQQKTEAISSIEKAQNAPSSVYRPTKPSLDNPSEKVQDSNESNYSSIMDFLNIHLKLEDVGKNFQKLRYLHIEGHYKDLEKLVQEESLAMKETLAHQRDVSFWGILSDIGNIITSAVSTVLGISMVSSGSTVLGAALITSGVLAITNITFKQTGAWDWIARQIFPEDENLRNQLATALPAVIGIITTILSISGTVGAYYYKQLGDFERFLIILETASSLITGVTTIGNGVAGYHAINSGAKLSFLQSMSSLSNIDLRNVLQSLTTFFDNQVEIKEIAGRIIEATQTQVQVTQQPV